ncbi:1736_t:CDS:1 [Paraglomus brasilianum]|uniref:1736_t:CDS:1 n=1 Tax=Paraglomus brasilianum TaxID=144538 RepID=A0A9N9GCP8_9GLOM|nr:1736_t:CDS:1 [Paraglomus brasilianum]
MWLLCQYGRTHALFHAVRIGNFINSEVVERLLEEGAQISRYFAQRMVLGFGKFDKTLIDLKQSHNVVTHYRSGNLWASNLPINVYTQLLRKAYERFEGNSMPIRGNDMEYFYYLSAGPLVISQARKKLEENLAEIRMLILVYKFAPFPPRPRIRKHIFESTESRQENYPPSDGYENVRQLNVIARAILIHPELVNDWKEIGYYEIVTDVNDLVMQGSLLILYPPVPAKDWVKPDLDQVINKLNELQSYGFKLTDELIGDALLLFENRLKDVGETLITAFATVRDMSEENIFNICLTELLDPERNLAQDNSLDFVINQIDNPDKAIILAFEKYSKINLTEVKNPTRSKQLPQLSYSAVVTQYLVGKFGADSQISSCLTTGSIVSI